MLKAFRVKFPTETQADTEDHDEDDAAPTTGADFDEESDDHDDAEESIWLDLDETEQEAVDDMIDLHCKKRISCFAHSLQLAVGDGLKATAGTGVGSVILKAHRLSSILHKSTTLRER